MMKVAKFGGSSLADAERIAGVCDIIASDSDRRITVVSAPGKRHGDDRKVTDMLIACAKCRLAGDPVDDQLAEVEQRYSSLVRELDLPDEVFARIRDDFKMRIESAVTTEHEFMDLVMAGGEDNCAYLVAQVLGKRGLNAKYVSPVDAGMVLSDEPGSARVMDETYSNLEVLRDSEDITIFPGFFGATRDGKVVTFPRGGSDITGAVLAAAVKADEYENFTDVDFVRSVDPGVVPDAKPISELTYEEMRELAYVGFGVFHHEAILPAFQAGIAVCIKNTFAPDEPGTRIVPDREHSQGHPIGIASDDGFCSVFVSKYMLNRELGFGRRLLQIFEDEGLSYEHTPSGIDNMSVVLREADFDDAMESRLGGRIKDELGAEVSVERGLALLMIVGEGMQHSVGIAAKATKAFADADVNIEMINQGSSEISMMFGVKASDADNAVRSLYKAFFSD